MMIKGIFRAITLIGADTLDLNERSRIIKVNILAIITGVMALFFGTFFYIVSGKLGLFLGTFVEGSACFYVIFLNKKRKYDIAAFYLQMIHNAATFYFGCLLSDVVEASLLAIFLIGTSLLIVKDKMFRTTCIVIAMITLVMLEMNRVTGIIPPYDFTPLSRIVIHYSAILVIVFLNILIIMFYVKHNDELLSAQKEHSENLEQQVQIRTAELEKANNYKSVFLRETNHEIRVPLNAIYSISQLLLMDAKKNNDTAYVKQAEHLCAASHHALDVINNVLELSRIEAGKLHEVHNEAFAIRSLLDNIADTGQYIAKTKGVRIVLNYNKRKLPTLLVTDKVKLTQIINNLLFNAVKFTADNSTITLSALVENDTCSIKVKDQGEGISQDKIAPIFDPFITGWNSFSGGTGLGLHIARHLANLLGGNITVESVVGKGTEFSFTFPLQACAVPVAQEEVPEVRMDESPYSGVKVLVIEDDDMSRIYLAQYLRRLGCELESCSTGADTIELLHHYTPDIILADRHLPDMEAGEILAYVRSTPMLRRVPVIVISGDVFEEDRIATIEAGAAAYLIKPVDFKLLNVALKQCLNSPALL
ncbi:ATP-binding protein [Chitinophaga sp. CF418]|uniref:ATP-binding response regulator n=1 Tax=Chitinophaga sp. CF418 TaxID=1855287 RepID=UPI000924843C|nr:ATP-binding protein [Chitinophaga sp. CF418]SHN19188.1 Signal transduction histidine kinase [Chitinophaga sp. CF418]